MTLNRNLVRRVHLIAGIVAFLTILSFWTTTVVSELFADHAAVAAAKQGILWGMIVLVPAMAAVGSSGFNLGGKSSAPIVVAKRKRMMIVGLDGLLILVPSAVFLAIRAADGQFDTAFYAVQAIELLAGATNVTLIALNMRDGLTLTRKMRNGGQRATRRRPA